MESLLLNGICVNLVRVYVTKLNGQTQLVLSGDRWDSREGKRWVQGMLYAALGIGKDYWYFFELLKGIMTQNLPEQILQRFVRLSADGNSQREVARMPGVSQGCISKILRRNRKTGRPHQRKRGGSMKIFTPREDRQLLRIQNELLHLGSSSANADDPPIREVDVSSNHSETASGRQILVSASSQMSQAHFGDTVSSVMSPGSPYTTVTVGSRCPMGRGWLMPASSLMLEIVARQSWGEEWAGRGGWSHEQASVHPDPEESNVAKGDGGVWT